MSQLVNKLVPNIRSYQTRFYALSATAPQKSKPRPLIACKHPNLDHYSHTKYTKFDEIPLASKGWTHHRSRGDFFAINPQPPPPEQFTPFADLNLDPALIAALKTQQIHAATDLQARTFAKFAEDAHLLLAAETGCGKTLAYLLPMLHALQSNRAGALNTPRALVLVPNRELAYQIGETAIVLAEAVGLRARVLVGGQTKRQMLNPEFGEVDLLVATPGALGKLSSVAIFKLHEVLFTVLDEADTLLDDSFAERLAGLLRRLGQSKLVLASATAPKSLPACLRGVEPGLRHVLSAGLHRPLTHVAQRFMRLTRSVRPSYLLQAAKANRHPMLVFTNRSQNCNWLAMFLRENGVRCSNINGDMNFAVRIKQWNDFIRGETLILSCTDVASRGLDTASVRHVLNYDFPIYSADYLHRVGRVGRRGGAEDGKITNFICGDGEVKLVQQIEIAIRKDQALLDVDGNITHIVQNKKANRMQQGA